LLKNKSQFKWHYFVAGLLRQGDTVIDIGANLGYFSYVFCKVVGTTGRVFSVEPVEPFRKQLQKQLRNEQNNTIVNVALGEENIDNIVLGIPEEYKQMGYLRHGLTSLLHAKNVEADGKFTFASSLKKGSEVFAHLDKIDYIKCDIEGYETIVFKEMSELIGRKRPLVQVESWTDSINTLYALFTEMGFKGYKLYDGKLLPIEAVDKSMWGNDDTLFVPDEKMDRIAPFIA
jgi:FkbM family methyltransferase